MSGGGVRELRKQVGPGGASNIQYGALPYRVQSDETLEVLLITSRETRRWIIPKGWPIKGLGPAQAAAREAFEEAGVHGRIERQLGRYVYDKYCAGRTASYPCEVRVYPLAVQHQSEDWPEASERQAHWYSTEEALSLVSEEGLRCLLRALESRKTGRFRKPG
jgi:8-oxo-dGTP pyrophosphatase MutT (NUDIX family)